MVQQVGLISQPALKWFNSAQLLQAHNNICVFIRFLVAQKVSSTIPLMVTTSRE
jgi:hypothetical protein